MASIDFRLTIAESLEPIDISAQIKNPVTLDEGRSKELFDNYSVIVGALVDTSRPE